MPPKVRVWRGRQRSSKRRPGLGRGGKAAPHPHLRRAKHKSYPLLFLWTSKCLSPTQSPQLVTGMQPPCWSSGGSSCPALPNPSPPDTHLRESSVSCIGNRKITSFFILKKESSLKILIHFSYNVIPPHFLFVILKIPSTIGLCKTVGKNSTLLLKTTYGLHQRNH